MCNIPLLFVSSKKTAGCRTEIGLKTSMSSCFITDSVVKIERLRSEMVKPVALTGIGLAFEIKERRISVHSGLASRV